MLSSADVLPCVCSLVAMYASPEYAQVRISSSTQYKLNPAVEVFVFGVLMGQLVDSWIWDGVNPPEDEYVRKLAIGQYQLPVSVHPCAFVHILHAPCASCASSKQTGLSLRTAELDMTSPGEQTDFMRDPFMLLTDNGVVVQWRTPGHLFCQQEVPDFLKQVIDQCVTYDPHHRPTMDLVTQCLRTILRSL